MPIDYQETTVNIVHVPDKRAHVWTCNRAVKTRLANLGFEPIKRQNGGSWYDIPARCIWFKSPKKRTLSEEQRKKMAAELNRRLNRLSKQGENRREPHHEG